MDKQKITNLTLDEINDEIDRITNFGLNGDGYGSPDAREADERKLRVLMSLREQKVATSQINESKLREMNLNKISTPISNECFVDFSRIDELHDVKSSSFDLRKLIKLCEELNTCYANECFLAVTMLTRAILDHIPPIFELATFKEVASNYGGKSFKNSMQHLQNSSRNIADANLHLPIRTKESLPNKVQVNFRNDLDVLLAEIIRILK